MEKMTEDYATLANELYRPQVGKLVEKLRKDRAEGHSEISIMKRFIRAVLDIIDDGNMNNYIDMSILYFTVINELEKRWDK